MFKLYIKYSKSYIEVYDIDKRCKKEVLKNVYYKEKYILDEFDLSVHLVKVVDNETKNMNLIRCIKYNCKHFIKDISDNITSFKK